MRPDCRRREAPPGEVRLAKACPAVQPRGCKAFGIMRNAKEKPPGEPGGFLRRRLEPSGRPRRPAPAARDGFLPRLRAALGPLLAAMHPAAHFAVTVGATLAAKLATAEMSEHG